MEWCAFLELRAAEEERFGSSLIRLLKLAGFFPDGLCLDEGIGKGSSESCSKVSQQITHMRLVTVFLAWCCMCFQQLYRRRRSDDLEQKRKKPATSQLAWSISEDCDSLSVWTSGRFLVHLRIHDHLCWLLSGESTPTKAGSPCSVCVQKDYKSTKTINKSDSVHMLNSCTILYASLYPSALHSARSSQTNDRRRLPTLNL